MRDDLSADLAPRLAEELGLKPAEYERVVEVLERTPTLTELYMYSLMWSEHCSYKHSRKALRMFPTEGPHVLQGPGENAGVIGVGDGWAVAFKMESHNHPSAIEPYEGASTGVGGVVRDIFAMGARPIAVLGSLRFGTLGHARQRYLFEHAVEGIGGYANRLGVPVVGGEVAFEEAYEGNCLIDAMGVGLLRADDLMRAVAAGPGNLLILIGSTTGRDGIGGASVLASQEFDQKAEEMRPAVQAGDPFMGKLLVEACLELLQRGLIVALGDLGAAGLTSSASEMAARGGVGVEIDVTLVPQREDEMKPFEVMVAESQERMLAVVDPSDFAEVQAVCERWELPATVIGKVTDTGRFVVREGEEVVGDMPARSLADDAPLYDPPAQRPAYLDEVQRFDPMAELQHPEGVEMLTATLFDLLASPNICSRRWIWEQCDHQAMLNTVVGPGSDAAVVRIGLPGRGEVTERAIAISTDCNGRYCYLDPYTGAQAAVAEAARNVACTGGRPAAITDCLNFGSPEKPEVFWTFVESIRGLADACRAWEVPVISGNVSFYNESFGKPIYPTPAVGLVGILEDLTHHTTVGFKEADDVVVLLGETAAELGGSEYLKVVHEVVAGMVPRVDLDHEAALREVLLAAIGEGIVHSAHDCSDGGLAVALAECCIAGGLGADIHLGDELPPVATLFSETQGRVVLTTAESDVERIFELAFEARVPFAVIGTVGGDALHIEGLIDASLAEVSKVFEDALAAHVHPEETIAAE